MKNYIVNNFKAINYQYAVRQSLPTWGDLEGCSLKAMMFEKYPSISPYTYCSNNPINKVDPTGLTDYNVEIKGKTERKTINDGLDGRVDVSKREFNKLERKHNRENGGYEKYRDKLKDKRGYTTGHPEGGVIFHRPKEKTTTTKLGVNVSLGAQAGGRVQVGSVKVGLEGNLNSINLLEGSIGKIGNDPLSLQGYALDYTDIHGNRGAAIPLILSYDYSYKARFEQNFQEHSVHFVNVLGYQRGSDGSSGFKISASAKVILGIEIYFERITK
ncbi:MAG: hypothetical protein KBA86_06775 [Bacteroidales bacterium]|nr:hypothetical protein [Bacteroidales bacterium]